jgi:hypothetical protein
MHRHDRRDVERAGVAHLGADGRARQRVATLPVDHRIARGAGAEVVPRLARPEIAVVIAKIDVLLAVVATEGELGTATLRHALQGERPHTNPEDDGRRQHQQADTRRPSRHVADGSIPSPRSPSSGGRSTLGQHRARQVPRPEHGLPIEAIFAEEAQALVGIAQRGMQLDDDCAHGPQQIGVALQGGWARRTLVSAKRTKARDSAGRGGRIQPP